MNNRIIDRCPWILSGFIIGISISLFVCFGIIFLLSLIEKLKLPEQEILIFSVLFYGIIFIIARSGVRVNTRRNRALVSRNSIKEFSEVSAETNSAATRTKTILWNMVTIISVVWLTPVLILYWTTPRHPNVAIASCCFIFSVLGAIAFLFKVGKQGQTGYNKLMFFIGVCSGVFVVILFSPGP